MDYTSDVIYFVDTFVRSRTGMVISQKEFKYFIINTIVNSTDSIHPLYIFKLNISAIPFNYVKINGFMKFLFIKES